MYTIIFNNVISIEILTEAGMVQIVDGLRSKLMQLIPVTGREGEKEGERIVLSKLQLKQQCKQ